MCGLATAVAVSDECVDLPGEQINPGQQAERAMTSSRAPWPCRTPKTPARPWLPA